MIIGSSTGIPSIFQSVSNMCLTVVSDDVPMNFPREQLRLTKEYGTGDFGKVWNRLGVHCKI